MIENDLYRKLLATESRGRTPAVGKPRPVTDYANLVRNESWRQVWNPDTRTAGQAHAVTGSIWSDAIECCLKENGSAYIPCDEIEKLIHTRCLSLNPDFPNTMPRGGTGCGRMVDPIVG